MNKEAEKSILTTLANDQTGPVYVGKDPKGLKTLWIWWLVLIISGSLLSFFIIGIPLLIAGAVIGYVMIYKFWSVIQDGKPRTTPGQAVGFCFIPFFNLYWFYVVWVGLAEDMNNYCRERQISVQISEGLAVTYYILVLITILTAWIPIIGFAMLFISGIPTFIIGAILTKSITDGAIKIIKVKQEGRR